MFPSGSLQSHQVRTEQLLSATDFVRIWPAIEALRLSIGSDADISIDPLHFLASTDAARPSRAVACWKDNELIGILYARAHHIGGIALGYAVSGDFMGRGSLLCLPKNEALVTRAACDCLMRNGIHSLQLRIAAPSLESPEFSGCHVRQFSGVATGDRLQLPADYKVFLASLGKHTRRNVRYYTRRTESAGIAFVSEVPAEEYSVAIETLCDTAEFSSGPNHIQGAYRMLELHSGNRFLLRDASGNPVAALCGFSKNGRFYVLFQLNDRRLPEMSLSLVLRGYTIQHLIETGHTELQFVDGSSLSLGRFCDGVDYRACFIDRLGWFRSSLKYTVSHLVEALMPDKVIPNTLGTLLGGYLSENRLLARTALRHPKLRIEDGSTEEGSGTWITGESIPSSQSVGK